MLIAKEKKNTNIAEYLIYMFQLEDIIRGCKFDTSSIEKIIIDEFEVSENDKKEIKQWYSNLVHQMKKENIIEKGHLSSLRKIITEFGNIHQALIEAEDKKYKILYEAALPNIRAYELKQTDSGLSEIEMCLNAVYGFYILKIAKKNVHQETAAAIEGFSKVLAYISKQYHRLNQNSDTKQ